MATQESGSIRLASPRRIALVRLAVSGGVAAAVIFILCWLGTFIPFASPTHAYIGLFTTAPIDSVQALAEGTFWSALFGGLVGLVFGSVYNLLDGFGSRGRI